jgi:hypothetical protein
MIYDPGIYEDVPEDDYFAVEALSKSAVPYILRSPAHFKQYRDNGITSQGITVGSLADCLILTPNEFEGRYKILPEYYINEKDEKKKWNGNANFCKEYMERLERDGVTTLPKKTYELALGIKHAVESNSKAVELLAGSRQISMFWIDTETGVYCKARMDNVKEGSFISDLKTSSDSVDYSGFRRTMSKYHYHIQAYVYTTAYELLTGENLPFNIVAVEQKPPHGVASYTVGPDSMMLGKMRWEQACRKYKWIQDNQEYPAYPEDLKLIELAPYALRPILEGDDDFSDMIIEE